MKPTSIIDFSRQVTEIFRSSWLQTLSNQIIDYSPYIRYTNRKYHHYVKESLYDFPCDYHMAFCCTDSSRTTHTSGIYLLFNLVANVTNHSNRLSSKPFTVKRFDLTWSHGYWRHVCSDINVPTHDHCIRFGMGRIFLNFFYFNTLMSLKWMCA